MRWKIACVLVPVLLGGCAQDQITSEPPPGYALESDIRDDSGIDYHTVLHRAWHGDETALRQFFQISTTVDGCYSEAVSERIRQLLEHLGDEHFSHVMQSCCVPICDEVVRHLLFAYGLDSGSEQTVVSWFQADYPRVSAVCNLQLADYVASAR